MLLLLAVQEGLNALAAPADDLGIVGRVDELPPERLRPLAHTLPPTLAAAALAAAALALASALASALGPSGALTLLETVFSVEPGRHRARVATTLATTATVATSAFEAAATAAFEAATAAFEAATAAFEAASSASAANPTAAASAAFIVLHVPVKSEVY